MLETRQQAAARGGPDLFPRGGVCHIETEGEAFRQLRALVRKDVEELQQAGKELPLVSTRPT